MLSKAILIATKVFCGVTDKGGQPYILHCLKVMDGVDQKDHDLMQIAVLHDVVEDSGYSLRDLQMSGFSSRVISGVSSMTRSKLVSYEDYIKEVAKNSDARKVKIADLRHNLDTSRLSEVSPSNVSKINKYIKALGFLEAIDDTSE